MTYQKNDLDIIELSFDVEKLLAQGTHASGDVGNFQVQFTSPINLNPNERYEIGLKCLYLNNGARAGFTKNPNSIFVYCDLCEASRVGSGIANVLHKSLNAVNIQGAYQNIGLNDVIKMEQDASIMDWKPLKSNSFSSIGFQIRDSAGAFYPNYVSNPLTTKRCFISVLIRKVGTSGQGKSINLNQIV